MGLAFTPVSMFAQASARFVGLVFLVAAAAKLWTACEFAAILRQLAPGVPVPPLFGFVVATEAAVGAALAISPESRRTTNAALCLLTGFTVVLLVGISRWGLTFRCHCLAGVLESSPLASVARNLLLALLLIPSRLSRRRPRDVRATIRSPRFRT